MKQIYAINWQLTMITLIMSSIITLFTFVFHGFIFRCLVAPQYREISWLLPGLVLASGLFATGQFAVISLLSETEARVLIIPKIGVAISGVLLNIIGAFWFRIPGVVCACVVTSAVYMLWVLYIVRARHAKMLTVG